MAATGQVLLHRFYCKHSMIDYDVKVRCCLLLRIYVRQACCCLSFAACRLWRTVRWPSTVTCPAAQRVAIAATWLASKLEEAPKKFRDVLMVFARIDSRAEERPPELLDPNSQVCTRLHAPGCPKERWMVQIESNTPHVPGFQRKRRHSADTCFSDSSLL